MPQLWERSVTVPIHGRGDKTVIIIEESPSLSTAYKILSNILLDRLTPYVNEIIGDHQCGFRRNRSITYQIFYSHQIL
jgi:hypothetical protein